MNCVKKRKIIVLLTLVLILTLFVACNSNVIKEDEEVIIENIFKDEGIENEAKIEAAELNLVLSKPTNCI